MTQQPDLRTTTEAEADWQAERSRNPNHPPQARPPERVPVYSGHMLSITVTPHDGVVDAEVVSE